MGQPRFLVVRGSDAREAVSVLRARRFVCVHLVEYRLLYLVHDVRLVVSELAANAVRHPHSPFTLSLRQADRAAFLERVRRLAREGGVHPGVVQCHALSPAQASG